MSAPSRPDLQLGVPLTGDRRSFLRQLSAVGLAGTAGSASAATASVTAATSASLRKLMRGTVVAKGEVAWPGWCESMVWQQRKPTRRPPLIVQAANETDVIEAVRFARRNGLKVAVRTGGHSVWASFMRDQGLLIDLSLLNRSSFNRDDRSAVVQPALRGAQLIDRAAPLGLAFPVSHCGQVGLGGYLIGGGLGLNHDHWGAMACFSIRGADVVTARGELVTVNASRNADLYWALRGAGQGFPGIVTKLQLALQPRPQVLSSHYVLPLARAAEASEWVQAALGDQRPAVEALMVLARGMDGQPAATVFANAFAVSADEARASLAPFAASELATAAVSKTEAAPSSLEKLLTDGINPMTVFGLGGHAVDTVWTSKTADAVAAAVEQIQRAASPLTHAVIAFKSSRMLPAAAACSRIDRTFVGLYAAWVGADGDEANVAWLREASTALQPFASGHYINEIDIEAAPHRARDCFSAKAWNRLADVRHRHDPERLFHGFFGVA
jgi:FAD/FMN-containing dehydrogenase